MIQKQIKFYKAWLAAVGRRHSYESLKLFIMTNKETLKKLKENY